MNGGARPSGNMSAQGSSPQRRMSRIECAGRGVRLDIRKKVGSYPKPRRVSEIVSDRIGANPKKNCGVE